MGKSTIETHKRRARRRLDRSRLGDVGVSLIFACFASSRLWASIRAGQDGDSLLMAHHAVVAGYMAIAALLPLLRRAPIARTSGLLPKIFATIGTYFIFLPLSLLPLTWRPDWLLTASTIGLTAIVILEIWALLSLQRSFSVFAEARALVTRGPYGHVRHPLYALYIFSYAFVVLPRLSIAAVLIAGLGVVSQVMRARREEQVLRSVFPEYEKYAARVPAFVPRFRHSASIEVPEHSSQPTVAEHSDSRLAA